MAFSLSQMAVLSFVLLCVVSVANAAVEVNPDEVKAGDVTFTTECFKNGMMVQVDVDSNFMGKIYPKDHERCTFPTNPADNSSYGRFFSYKSTFCGQTVTTTADDDREASITIIVQFSPDVLMTTDKSHTAKCKFDNVVSVGTQLGSVNGSELNLDQSEGEVDVDTTFSSSMEFKLQKDGTNEEVGSDDDVPLGQALNLVAELTSNGIFSTLLLTNCEAANRNLNNPNVAEYAFLKITDANGCLVSGSLQEVVPEEPTYETTANGYKATLAVKAFIFAEGRVGNTNELHVGCDILLCSSDNAGLCDYDLNCNGMGTARRRRSSGTAGGNGTELVSAERSVQVFIGTEADRQDKTVAVRSGDCLNDHKVQSIIVAMGILLLALLMAVIALVVLFSRRRGRHGDKTKQAADGLSMGLAPDHAAKHRG